jgi:predicted dithiol-disulfide oxidoreductase (DUF899 family)
VPWVRVEKQYAFETADGRVSLADLFGGRSQLLVYHFMFGPDDAAGCPACSALADGFNGFAVHLANHDVRLWAVSRATLPKLRAYQQRMGWAFPWASALDSDFNFDHHVTFSVEQQRQGIEYNYRRGRPAPDETGVSAPIERPGMSAFALEDGAVYHTYSTYARGLDVLWGMYQWLDRAPRGRNESGFWIRRRDEYGAR